MNLHLPSIDAFLALTGFTLTALFGVWSLLLAYRALRYPAHITYVHRAFVPLFGALVHSLPDLSVSLDGKPLGQNVILAQGAFVARGHKDITASMVEKPLTLRLKRSWRWLAIGSIEASAGLQPEITITQSRIEAVVSFGALFRSGEYIAFTALLELDPDTPRSWSWWWNPVSCHHRIVDTQVDLAAAASRRLAPTLKYLAETALYGILIGSMGTLFSHDPLILFGISAVIAFTFVMNIGLHLWRRRAVRVLPERLLPDY